MLKLPPKNHPAREMFEMADLAERASPQHRRHLPALNQAKALAQEALRRWPLCPTAVNYFVLRASGEIQLVSFDRSGHHVVWNFGQ